LAEDVIRQLDQRVDLFRLNLSHMTVESVEPTIAFVRRFTDKPLCLDTDGSQIRCGNMAPDVSLKEGSTIQLTPDAVIATDKLLTLRPAAVFRSLRKGHLLSVDFDGVCLEIESVSDSGARAVVLEGGRVRSNKAVTIRPNPTLPALTSSDIEAIAIGKELGIKHVALSFARRAEDVQRLRKLAGRDSFVISKIETQAGVRNLDAIIDASDAVLIDRGDLSREIPLQYVPVYQKEIIRRANSASMPAYVATNLLESMVSNRLPTIAEANDIINTLHDGAHGLVLAAETTIGSNPVASVEMVASLIEAFEWSRGRSLIMPQAGPRLGEDRPLRAVHPFQVAG
jgi:pyruvate kinase